MAYVYDKARWELKHAYRPGYTEAADRAGIDVHVLPIALSGGWHKEARDFIAVLPIALSGGWHKEARDFIAKVQHQGDKAAQVGVDSEKCRF